MNPHQLDRTPRHESKKKPKPKRPNSRRILLCLTVVLGLPVGAVMIKGCAAVGKAPRGDRIKRSPNWADGRFVNPLPPEDIPCFHGSVKRSPIDSPVGHTRTRPGRSPKISSDAFRQLPARIEVGTDCCYRLRSVPCMRLRRNRRDSAVRTPPTH